MVRCFEITPSDDSHYDSLIIPAGDSWKNALLSMDEMREIRNLVQEPQNSI